jgi:hypothetical protein
LAFARNTKWCNTNEAGYFHLIELKYFELSISKLLLIESSREKEIHIEKY